MNDLVELTQKLVQAPSIEGQSINAARVLYDYLDENGLNPTLNEYKDGEANVYCDLGPKNTKTMLISGHLDTVPIGNRDDWTHDPFSGKILDGLLWGRGSVDMKGGTATLAAVMTDLLKQEDDLQQRVFLAATAEEETGLQGAHVYVQDGHLKDLSHVIIAEPTDLAPKIREKGIMWFRIHAKGKQSHASRPDLGHNAIAGLAAILPKLTASLPELETPDLGRTSLNFGVISGGTAANVVPQEAELICDSRSTPGVDNADVLEGIARVVEEESGDVKFSMEVLENVPSILSPNDDFANLLNENTAAITGKTATLEGVHYATDGAIFMEAVNHAVPFVIYGPGSTELLHQTNERLEVNQLDIARKVYLKSILQTIGS
ncbi:MAG: M20 family metallopeptidase [Candidatus Kariarchaeaceae archaeon]|jgi:succinyl-diaminopimelate desuccinylase